MKILALDSSSGVASVAFLDRGDSVGAERVLFHQSTPHPRSDSSALFAGLEESVRNAGQPDAIVVGLGPGSYNGLRAGIAAARAFATARGIPMHAFPSPLALPGPASGFWAAGDARGGHWWIACVRGFSFLEEPFLLSPAEASIHLQSRPGLPILAQNCLPGVADLEVSAPDAALLALLVIHRQFPYETCLGDRTPEPIYLKPPHITTPRAIAPAP